MAVIHSYFDLIIAEEITHLSYYMKGNVAGMYHRIFFHQEKISKRKTEKKKQYAFALCHFKNFAMFKQSRNAGMDHCTIVLEKDNSHY